MGILAEPLQFVRDLRLPKGFSVCELGDQYVTAKGKAEKVLAGEFYKELGCGEYVSVDGNGRGTVTWDLNHPIGVWPRVVYDLVTDFGTGEHVFDQAEVWRTIHALTKQKGFIAFDRPCAGYQGHCFYLIQENLIAAIAHANDYDVLRFQRARTTRGELLRGVMQKLHDRPFVIPQQGRYFKDLAPIMDAKTRANGPDWKSRALRAAGVVRRGVGDVIESEDDDDGSDARREHRGWSSAAGD